MAENLKVDVYFEHEAEDQVLTLLTEAGAEKVGKVKSHGFVGIETVVAAVLAATALGNLVVKLLGAWRAGVIVDARGTRIRITRSSKLPRGEVIVFSRKGIETKVSGPKDSDLGGLIKAALSKE